MAQGQGIDAREEREARLAKAKKAKAAPPKDDIDVDPETMRPVVQTASAVTRGPTPAPLPQPGSKKFTPTQQQQSKTQVDKVAPDVAEKAGPDDVDADMPQMPDYLDPTEDRQTRAAAAPRQQQQAPALQALNSIGTLPSMPQAQPPADPFEMIINTLLGTSAAATGGALAYHGLRSMPKPEQVMQAGDLTPAPYTRPTGDAMVAGDVMMPPPPPRDPNAAWFDQQINDMLPQQPQQVMTGGDLGNPSPQQVIQQILNDNVNYLPEEQMAAKMALAGDKRALQAIRSTVISPEVKQAVMALLKAF